MKKQEKLIIAPAIILAFSFALPFSANAMHIMEGFLPVGHVIAWSLIALPFLIAGYMSIKKTIAKDRKSITLLAMSGAFVFVLSSLKIPSVSGSCSHMTGTGLAAILFGPSAVSILGRFVCRIGKIKRAPLYDEKPRWVRLQNRAVSPNFLLIWGKVAQATRLVLGDFNS